MATIEQPGELLVEPTAVSLFPTTEVEVATVEQPGDPLAEPTAVSLSSAEVEDSTTKHAIQKSVNESQEEYEMDTLTKSFEPEPETFKMVGAKAKKSAKKAQQRLSRKHQQLNILKSVAQDAIDSTADRESRLDERRRLSALHPFLASEAAVAVPAR